MKKNLKNHVYSNCYVVVSESRIDFYSYRTRVITITYDNTVECTGLYSATTRRQIGWFLQEYYPALNYYDMKKIAGCGVQKISAIISAA